MQLTAVGPTISNLACRTIHPCVPNAMNVLSAAMIFLIVADVSATFCSRSFPANSLRFRCGVLGKNSSSRLGPMGDAPRDLQVPQATYTLAGRLRNNSTKYSAAGVSESPALRTITIGGAGRFSLTGIDVMAPFTKANCINWTGSIASMSL